MTSNYCYLFCRYLFCIIVVYVTACSSNAEAPAEKGGTKNEWVITEINDRLINIDDLESFDFSVSTTGQSDNTIINVTANGDFPTYNTKGIDPFFATPNTAGLTSDSTGSWNFIWAATEIGTYKITFTASDDAEPPNVSQADVILRVFDNNTLAGQGLYDTKCTPCHGANGDGSGSTGGPVIGNGAKNISTALQNIQDMNGISLTDIELSQIADYLCAQPSIPATLQDCGTVVNSNPPVFKNIPNPTINVDNGELFDIAVSAIDPFGNSTIHLEANGDFPAFNTGGIDPLTSAQAIFTSDSLGNGRFVWDPAGNLGIYKIEIVATDNGNPPLSSAIQLVLSAFNNAIISGKSLYESNCSVCHGPEGQGGTTISIAGTTTTNLSNALNNIAVMRTISISTSEITQIVDYLCVVAKIPLADCV